MPLAQQGHTIERYCLIPRSLVFLTRGDQVLLIKGAPTKKLWPDQYNGIGGHIEPGEDILTAAHREVLEETGLKPEGLRLCGTIHVDTGESPGICVFIFRGNCTEGSPVASEEGIPSWNPIDEISKLPLVEDLHTLLPKVLSHQKDDPPLSFLYTYDEEDHLVITWGD